MRKRILHIVCILTLAVTSAWSQADETRYYRWSFGISAGDILHQLFNVDATNRSYAAFVMEYAGQQYSLQAGFRPGYNTLDTQYEGFLDNEVSEQLSLSGHLALMKSLMSEQRWHLKAGLRYEGGWSREDMIVDSGFDRVTTRRLQWNGGAGPMIDLRFFVHPRISLGTDAGLIFAYSQSELQQLFTNFPEFDNTKEKVIDRKLNVVEPMTIYLRFHL